MILTMLSTKIDRLERHVIRLRKNVSDHMVLYLTYSSFAFLLD